LREATEERVGQADDYRHWKKAGDRRGLQRRVLLLTRDVIESDGFDAMTWTHAAHVLRKEGGRSDLVQALVEHLEEEGIVMQNIAPKPLVGFMKRLVLPTAAGAHAGNLSGPAEFAKLLQNMKLLSARFNPLFKQAWGLEPFLSCFAAPISILSLVAVGFLVPTTDRTAHHLAIDSWQHASVPLVAISQRESAN
jgi:hypothetical protein